MMNTVKCKNPDNCALPHCDCPPTGGAASELNGVLSAMPEDLQYAIYHALISAGGYPHLLRNMTVGELEYAKALATELHAKFLYGNSR